MAKLNEGSVIKKTAGHEIIATIPDVSVKADKTYVDTELGKKVNNTRVLTDVPSGAKFTDTVYTHPVSHPASMITESTTKRFVTDTEKNTWNAKETPTGAQTKATTAQTNAKTYTDTELTKKVDKVTGKELSTNDYTTAEKNKLSGIATGAQVNTVTSVSGKTGAVTLTKSDVGLGSVQNYAIATQTEANAGTSDGKYMTPLKTLGVVDAKIALSNSASKTDLTSHTDNVANPHGVTKSQVGLSTVQNYSVATQSESEAGTSDAKYMTPLKTKQAITSIQAVKSVAGRTGAVVVSKADVGLGSVTNVAQASKSEFNTHASKTATDSTLGHIKLTDIPDQIIQSSTAPTGTKMGRLWLDLSEDIVYEDRLNLAEDNITTLTSDINTHKAESANKHIKDSRYINGGYVIEYDDGTLMQFKTVKYTGNITGTWGTLFSSPDVNLGDWPIPFSGVPYRLVDVRPVGIVGVWTVVSSNATTTSMGTASLVRPLVSSTVTTYDIDVCGIWRWKP